MIQYEKFKLGKYPVLSQTTIIENDFREIFSEHERELVNIALQIQTWQLGEGPLPDGMDFKQSQVFMSSETLKSLAAKANVWYFTIGGKKEAIAGPFLVGIKIKKT